MGAAQAGMVNAGASVVVQFAKALARRVPIV